MTDFRYQFAVQYLVVFIQYHNRTSRQAGQWTFSDGNTVVLDELAATQGGQVLHVFQAFGTAEARLGKRQVSGDAQHDGIGQVIGLSVELAYGSGASRGVDAWEDVQHLRLPAKVASVTSARSPATSENAGAALPTLG